MREMVNRDSQNLVSNSFLLDDDLWYASYKEQKKEKALMRYYSRNKGFLS